MEGLDIDTVMLMGGSFAPLVWMMGLSNYYTGSKRGRPLGFSLSFLLGLLTFGSAMTAVISLMAICKYDLDDSKNKSSMPVYILALFLLCMDLWLDRPLTVPPLDSQPDPLSEHSTVLNRVADPGWEGISRTDIAAYLTLCLAAILSVVLMHQQRSFFSLWPLTDLRNLAGIVLAFPIIMLIGKSGQVNKSCIDMSETEVGSKLVNEAQKQNAVTT